MARRAKLLGLDAPEKVEQVAPQFTLDAFELGPIEPDVLRLVLGTLAKAAKREELRAALEEQLAMVVEPP
jgi:hypothetical protein